MTATQQHEMMAWLGPAAGDLTAEQVDRLVRESDDIAAYWPDLDDADLREAALSAAVQHMLGDITPEQVAAELGAARLAAARAFAAAQQVAAMVVRDHPGQRIKRETARRCGIDRMTLLKRLGER
jgi:hypothetical protein